MVTVEAMSVSTRQRILEAAVELFGERGFKGSPISAIEERAGLSPGAGGLYRHFASKQELLEAALEPVLESVQFLEQARSLLPLGDLRSELTVLARGGLAGIAASRPLLRIIERDPDVIPEFRERARTEVIERGYALTADLIVDLARVHELPIPANVDGLARLATGTLTNLVREAEIYRSDTASYSEQVIEAWVDVFHAYLTRPQTQLST